MISPDCLLTRRHGNCFEMATLLCSLLIGNNYDAYVCYGYATREVANNDQRRVDFPFLPTSTAMSSQTIDSSNRRSEHRNKYSLKDPIDLQSEFERQVEQRKANELSKEKERKLQEEAQRLQELERLDDDPEQGNRLHAWIVILYRGQKVCKKFVTDQNRNDEIRAHFIEPTTGLHFDATDERYLAIESIWNNENYLVSRP